MTAIGMHRVTREMVQARTRELALRAGRVPPYVAQADYEQAKRELTGESDLDRQEALLESTTAAASDFAHGWLQMRLQRNPDEECGLAVGAFHFASVAK